MIVENVPDISSPVMTEDWGDKKYMTHTGDVDVILNELQAEVETSERTEVLSVEQPERYSIASSPIRRCPSYGHVIDSHSGTSCPPPLHQNDAQTLPGDSYGDDETLDAKTASFYIGGDEIHSPPTRQKSQVSCGTPWKVSVAGTAVVEFTPPDGGYGWVVALAACFINLWIVGFIKSYGVLYVAIREEFPEASAYHISWIPSFLSTIGLLTAPLTGIMCRRFTSRKVSFFGGLVCFLGIFFGSMAANVNHLIASIGLLCGLGAGITTTSGILIVSLYFERRRTFASSICLSGNALGGFFLPPLVDYLLNLYGLRGTLLILAALQLHICAASMFFRPISDHALVQAVESQRKAGPHKSKDKLVPPGKASSRFKAFCCRVKNRYIREESIEESELQQQVSFLRSASMMNSVPNLTLYARSWSMSGEKTILDSRPSIHVGSRSSLSNNSDSLIKFPLFSEHPSVLRLSSEDDSIGRSSPVQLHQHGGLRRSSLSRIMDRRSSLTRQTSIRTVQSRIMEAVPEQDKEDNEIILESLISESNEKERNLQIEVKERDNEMLMTEKDIKQGEENLELTRKVNCCGRCIQGLCDTTLFRDGLFWMMSISVFLVACGTPFSFFYLPSYTDSISISSTVTTGMLSISALLDLIGRLGTGFISDLHFCQLHHIYVFSSLAAGISTLLLPHITNTAALTAVLSMMGFFIGSWFVMIPAVLAAHHGASKLAASYGAVRFFNGIMNFISPQVTGMLYDFTQSYKAVYTLMGSSMMTGAMVLLLAPLIRCCTTDKKDTNNHKSPQK